jgi:hypothetical protein
MEKKRRVPQNQLILQTEKDKCTTLCSCRVHLRVCWSTLVFRVLEKVSLVENQQVEEHCSRTEKRWRPTHPL